MLVSQTAFAVKAGIGRERLASYESGRVPIPWSVAFQICTSFDLNPIWLGAGEGERKGNWGGFDARFLDALGTLERRPLLSEVVDEIILPIVHNTEFSPRVAKVLSCSRKRTSHSPLMVVPSSAFLNVPQSSAWNRIAYGLLRDTFAAVPRESLSDIEAELSEVLRRLRNRFNKRV